MKWFNKIIEKIQKKIILNKYSKLFYNLETNSITMEEFHKVKLDLQAKMISLGITFNEGSQAKRKGLVKGVDKKTRKVGGILVAIIIIVIVVALAAAITIPSILKSVGQH